MDRNHYENLRIERDKISGMLNKPMPERYKKHLQEQLTNIRKELSNGHREEWARRVKTHS